MTRLAALLAAAVAVSGCSGSPDAAPPPASTAPAAPASLAVLWEPELRALDTTPCEGDGDGARALTFDCERVLREVARVAPLVQVDGDRREVPALVSVAREAGVAANQWLDGGTCTRPMAATDKDRMPCLLWLRTAMNGPFKMLETMKQSGK